MIILRETNYSLTNRYFQRIRDNKPVTSTHARIAEEETAGQLARFNKKLAGLPKEIREDFLKNHGKRYERALGDRITSVSLLHNFAGNEANMPKNTSKRIVKRIKQIAKEGVKKVK